jgi:hypothetical protein
VIRCDELVFTGAYLTTGTNRQLTAEDAENAERSKRFYE